MENGRTEQIIEKLVEMLENGQTVPLATGKVLVNKDEAVRLIRELESLVQGELKIYRDVNDKRGKILTDAKKEAEEIIAEAEQSASRIRVNKGMSASVLKGANLDLEDKQALRTAGDIFAASLIYTDEMLTEVNDLIADSYDMIVSQYDRLVKNLEEKAQIIAENKAELMGNLKELSKEDRYGQILELSQILSNELYNARKEAERERQDEKPEEAESKEEMQEEVQEEAQEEPKDLDTENRTGQEHGTAGKIETI